MFSVTTPVAETSSTIGPMTTSEPMRTVDFSAEGVRVVGMLDRDVGPTGFVIRRFPASTRAQVMDIFTNTTTTMPSGVHIAFRTTSPVVELDVNATTLILDGVAMAPPSFDIVIDDGEPVRLTAPSGTKIYVSGSPSSPSVTFEEGAADTLRFSIDQSAEEASPGHTVEIWLSHYAIVEVQALRVASEASVAAAPELPSRWVHYGSSISHCLEADGPTDVWPVVAARATGVELQSLAVAGCCHLDQYAARTIRDLDVQAISLKLGINIINGDTMRERTFGSALHGFLDTVREGHPTTPIVLISPIICPVAEHRPGPTGRDANGQCCVYDRAPELNEGALTLVRIRELIEQVIAARVALGDSNLHYLHGHELFGAADVGDLPDGLHPNSAGYRRMGERFVAHAFAGNGPFSHLATHKG